MIRTQLWTPDTCASPSTGDACQLEETWDDALPPLTRTHDFKLARKLCSRHAATHGANHAAAFAANYDENKRKNITFSIAVGVKNTVLPEQFVWSFDASAVLRVTFGSALTTNQRNQLQAAADVQFGAGKVVVS